ncbi:MAG: aminotransferase class III-fold pyridoxal phosphate-dependent enzyme [Bacteroidetes bacterium]|nr:aminotransferase class III-fold pyridoxal phosphate-dependent enzyme [Bacteroidota bacterium]
MISNRQLFLNHVAQTSPTPLGLEIVRAEGEFLFDVDGKKHVDLISGISVSNVGHRHPKVVHAIHHQLEKYMHLNVYGEYVQAPQTKLAEKIAQLLPPTLNSCYFTNSGAEAIEGALKLAKRITERSELISFENAYHGSTHGALSIMGNEYFKTAFRPLLPGTRILRYNNFEDLILITRNTACVVVEPIQGEAGAIVPYENFLEAIRKRCDETGTLLIFDEIQTGFGRTGKLFGFQHSNAIPDIIVFAKGLGGGMPIGAFVSSKENMQTLTENPVLGHITTFGGNAVCCAAALATIETILDEKLVEGIAEREKIILETLKHPAIKELRGKGLLFAAILENPEIVKNVIQKAVKKGVITDWFLFCDYALRIAPPLNIDKTVLKESCEIIVSCL